MDTNIQEKSNFHNMKYNFDKVNNRKNTNSYKWDTLEKDDIIPLWVADMDFQTAPCIIEALKHRVEQGIFGYTAVPDSYYKSVINWFSTKHNLQLSREEIIYTSGVVPAISAVIKGLTKPGDKVIVQTPVYNCFFSSISNNDCEIFENKLIYKNNTYYIDFDDLEKKASDPNARLLLLCNPHNPAGRVWTFEELERIGEICNRHDVTVVSDEIHCEIVFEPHKFTSYASVSEDYHEKCVICCSPSKAFNIAGLQIANIFVRDQKKRAAIDKAININEVCDVNPFGVIALQEAYNHGEDWLKQLNEYIYNNYKHLKQIINEELPEFSLTELEGTYLAWLDCSVLQMSSKEIADRLLHDSRVYVNSGEMYKDPEDHFIRINLATPRTILDEGVLRIIKGLKQIKAQISK